MSKSAKVILGILVIILVIWGISAATKKGVAPVATNSEPIKIGFIGPLSGDAANVGQNAKAAVEVAIDEINANNGINGRPLEVVFEDGKCNGSAAASAANKLISVDKVPVIIGGACSGETMSFAQTADQSKTTVLSYCSSVPALTTAGDYIFRNYPSDTFQGVFAADYMFNKLGKKNVAVLYVKTDYGTGIQAVFAPEFTKLGGKVVLNEGYDQNTKDVRTLLAKVKATKADAVYIIGYSNESIVILNQAKELGIKTTWLGGDSWDDSVIWTTVGTAGEGAMYVRISSMPNEAFKTALAAKIGTPEIAACSPTAYDATKIIAQVMLKVGSDSTMIKDELYKTEYTGGVSSSLIKFDSNGDLVGASYSIIKIEKGVATTTAL